MTLELGLILFWFWCCSIWLFARWITAHYEPLISQSYRRGWDACAQVARWNVTAGAELPIGTAKRGGAFFSNN